MRLRIITITQNINSAQNIRGGLLYSGMLNVNDNVEYKKIIVKSSSGILGKVLNKIEVIYGIVQFLLTLKKGDIVYCYGDMPSSFIRALNIFRFKVIMERTEYPNAVLREGKEVEDESLKKLKNISAFVTCSTALSNYYSSYFETKKVYSQYYPVDVEPFKSTISNRNRKGNYIAYAGYMGGNKDGLEDLIYSFSQILDTDIRLKLAGSAPLDELNALKGLVKKLKLVDRVIFLGNLDHHEIPNFYTEAKVCVLQRPNNIQAKGGMPSKLLEYIASGTPTIVTDVGDISKIFTNKEHCYIVKSGNNNEFGKMIDHVLANYNEAKVIASQGVKLVKNHHFIAQADKLNEFISKLND
ncbi:glycosyltransferase family 4 protein [Vibrio sp.]|nr:glycosyltransferase family 4 protein [Vibrio sp.]